MSYYISFETGEYYQGDKANWQDIEVPERPSRWHEWSGTEWIENVTARTIFEKQEEIYSIQRSFTDTIQMQAIVELASTVTPVVLDTLETSKWVIEKAADVAQLKQDIEDLQNP